MEKKTKVLIASALVVGLVAVASAQTGLFKGSFSDLKKYKISSSSCSQEVDKLGIYASKDGKFVTSLASEVYSLVGSQVPSIVWSEVDNTKVPSIVTSWVPSRNASNVSSEVEVDNKYIDKCLTFEEKKGIIKKSRNKAVKEAKETIERAKSEIKVYDNLIKEVTITEQAKQNAASFDSKTIQPQPANSGKLTTQPVNVKR